MGQEFHFVSENDGLEDKEDEALEDPNDSDEKGTEDRVLKVRLDKWLWAARFFKTRAVARAAVEKGKVFYNGERCKPSREIEIDAVLQIRYGRIEKTVIIKKLSTRRRSQEEALQLFEETKESITTREQQPRIFSDPFHYSQKPDVYSPNLAKEHRPVRFLRRSFNRGEERSSHRSYSERSTQPEPDTLD